jgi:hypothetical protein
MGRITRCVLQRLPHSCIIIAGHMTQSSFFLQIYAQEDLDRAKLEIVKKTSMMDYAIGVYHEMHGEDAEVPLGASLHLPLQHVGKERDEGGSVCPAACFAVFPPSTAPPNTVSPLLACLSRPSELVEKKEAVLELYEKTAQDASKLASLIDDGELHPSAQGVEIIQADNFNFEYLSENHGVRPASRRVLGEGGGGDEPVGGGLKQ